MSASKEKANSEKIKGVVRHVLTLIGGILIAIGFITADEVEILTTAIIEIVGAVFTIWSVIASWKNKEKLTTDVQA